MLYVVYSNRQEELVDEMAERMEQRESIFKLAHLIVPNRSVEEYVKMRAASSSKKMIGSLKTHTLSEWLEEILFCFNPCSRYADKEVMRNLLLDLFHSEEILERPELAPVRYYLQRAMGDPKAHAQRCFQLAEEVASSFEEYHFHDPEKVLRWTESGAVHQDGDNADELWRAFLWNMIFNRANVESGGLITARSHSVPFVSLLHQEFSFFWKGGGPFYFFGFPFFPKGIYELFRRLSDKADLWVFSMNPCQEYWEDIECMPSHIFCERTASVGQEIGGSMQEGKELFPFDPVLLKSLGKVSQSHVRMLDDLTQGNRIDCFHDPLKDGNSLLHYLQHDLLTRAWTVREEKDRQKWKTDQSVSILSCSSVRRELETIGEEIWKWIRHNHGQEARPGASLCFDEIAVMVSDAEWSRYVSHISAVFEEMHGIPHVMCDIPLSSIYPSVEAIDILLGLPAKQLTYSEWIRLIRHPACIHWTDGQGVELWERYLKRFGAIVGVAEETGSQDPFRGDLANWERALRRLALGIFMAGDLHSSGAPFRAGKMGILPVETSPSEMHVVAQLLSVFRSLLADIRFARSSLLTGKEWVCFFCDLVSMYIRPAGGEDTQAFLEVKQHISSMGSHYPGDFPISFELAHQLIQSSLHQLSVSRGGRGVRIGPVSRLEGLPFRIVFGIGFGETSPFSCDGEMWKVKPRGEMLSIYSSRDRDASVLLSLLLSARERLYLSYVNQDAKSGERTRPSLLVEEFIQIVQRDYLVDQTESLLVRSPYPCRYDPRLFPSLFPEEGGTEEESIHPIAYAEASALALCQGHFERVTEISSPSIALKVIAQRISLRSLRRFLEDPLQEFVRTSLGLKKPSQKGEPYEPSFFKMHPWQAESFLHAVWIHACNGGLPLEKVYDEEVSLRRLKGELPVGWFADAQRRRHLHILLGWQKVVRDQLGVPHEQIKTLCFGSPWEGGGAMEVLAPLLLKGGYSTLVSQGRHSLELSGIVNAFAGNNGIFLFRRSAATTRFHKEKEKLRCFLKYVTLCAAGMIHGEAPYPAHICTVDPTPSVRTIYFPSFSTQKALDYLHQIASDLLKNPHFYFFPFEAVVMFQESQDVKVVETWMEEVRNSGREDGHAIELNQRYPLPSLADIEEILERRFGLFFHMTRSIEP
ncbi:exodeoxyribonuclease V subunit gamma [Pajaroellobacter abortibovis]|uniref:RecC C-terminal domain-containing protein n=1 Tax=Pajaroellobacter abortibovis TaxID=1882918 RepID=A0A1L6MWW8_9BACT|nr:exodeoxyribonuclease V subunit gamma [Pajaroellobacter abortibovis]APR99954.1 hypothetical protein BCY86_04100 [Pajaroellobacter abortibovis]